MSTPEQENNNLSKPIDQFASLVYRPDVIIGDPNDFIHIEWAYELWNLELNEDVLVMPSVDYLEFNHPIQTKDTRSCQIHASKI